jgi:outer membrane receptor protein involved in Fe transport
MTTARKQQLIRTWVLPVLFCCISLIPTLNGQAQVAGTKGNLGSIVRELEKKWTDYKFLYDFDALQTRSVTAKPAISNLSLEQVLSALRKDGFLTYRIEAKSISIAVLPFIPLKKEPGIVTGKVIDEENGQPVAGASFRAGNRGTTTQVDGSFNISLPQGKYEAELSSIGYGKKIISGIEVKEGQLTNLTITLKRNKGQLAAVVVKSSARKEGVNAHYTRQKNAATVTDGISAEQISRTPDNDMGQVLKRVSGLTTVDNKTVIVRGMSDRYNQAMLDGVSIPSTSMNKRNFSFDIIPVEMVSNVVVNKTATPDMSSEFSGGQVSINTLDIPTQNFTTISFGTGGNSQTTGKDFYRLGERHSSEYFGFFDKSAKKPEGLMPWYWNNDAIQLDAPPGTSNDPILDDWMLNHDRPDLKYNDLDAIAQSRKLNVEALKLQKYTGKPNQNYRVALGRVYKMKNNLQFGFSASANLRNEENIVHFNNVRGQDFTKSYIDSSTFGQNGAGTSYRFSSSSGLVGNFGLQAEKFKIALKNMYARTYSNNYNEAVRLDYRDETHAMRKELYQLPEAMSLQQHQLTGEWQLPAGIKFEGMLAYNKIGQQILDERKFQYRLTAQVGGEYYFQSPNLLTHSGWSNNTVALDSRMWTSIDEKDYNWAANFSRTFGKGSSWQTLVKTGYQGWTKKRALDVFRMLPMTRSAKPGELLAPVEIPYEVLLDPANTGAGTNQAYYYAENIGGRIFDGGMNSHAMYLMADQKLFGKLRLVYGARLEYYDLSNRQAALLQKRFGNEIPDYLKFQEEAKEQDWQLLPSINATYSFTNTFNFRASYSKTAIRPDFRETSFFGFYDYELDANVSGQDVVSTMIDNYDLRLEWYPSPGEIISLTGYYKYLDKPIELVNNPSFQDGSYYVYANMASAKNYGLEMELRKNFSFIGNKSWLSNLFVYANGTLLKSTVNYEGPWQFRTVEGVIERYKERIPGMNRPLIGQSPWLLNLGLGYWGDYFGATASYNHRGYRSNLIRKEPYAIEYELAPRLLDFQVYGRFLKKKMEIKINMANMLNEWTRYYVNAQAYEHVNDGSGQLKFNLVKGNNGYKKEDGDLIMYRRQEGQRFSITATYKF